MSNDYHSLIESRACFRILTFSCDKLILWPALNNFVHILLSMRLIENRSKISQNLNNHHWYNETKKKHNTLFKIKWLVTYYRKWKKHAIKKKKSKENGTLKKLNRATRDEFLQNNLTKEYLLKNLFWFYCILSICINNKKKKNNTICNSIQFLISKSFRTIVYQILVKMKDSHKRK